MAAMTSLVAAGRIGPARAATAMPTGSSMLGVASPQARCRRTSARWIGAPARPASGVATTAMLAAMSSHALARGAARGGPATKSGTGARRTMSVRAPSTPTSTHFDACASYRAGDSRRHVLRGRRERGRNVRRLLRPCRSARIYVHPDDRGRPFLLLRLRSGWLLPLAQVRICAMRAVHTG